MYAKTARNSLLAVLKEAPEMKLGKFPRPGKPDGPISDHLARQLTDRLLMELWHRGFAVSARKPSDLAPMPEGRDPQLHAAWRATKGSGQKTRAAL